MVKRTMALRICVGIALALAAVATMAAVSGVRAQDNNLASITLYKAVCPEDYTGTAYYEDCFGNPGSGFTFTLTGPGFADGSRTTAESGFTAFEGIAADGTYTLTESFPPDIVDFTVFCSEGGEPFPLTFVEGGVQFDLTTADDLRCDWFNVPAGPATNDQASITIYKAVCPAEYAGTDYFADCFDTPGSGYAFTLAGPDDVQEGTTGATGFVAFEGITTAGTYTLTETPPAGTTLAGFVVVCSEGGADFPVTYVEGGVQLTLDVNDDLRCDWYDIPGDNALASVTIYKAICPPGYAGDDFFADCADTPGADIAFALSGPAGTADATTGAGGLAAFEGIDVAGTYTITETVPADVEEFVVFCSEAGAAVDFTYVDAGISLDLALDDDLRCDWYNIPVEGAPTPTPAPGGTTGGVTTLPSTGTGAGDAGTNPVAIGWALALIGVAAVAFRATGKRLGLAGRTRR